MHANILDKFEFFVLKLLVFVLAAGLFIRSFSQKKFSGSYEYLSPVPNAELVQPESEIIIRQGKDIRLSTLLNDFIIVRGSKSGNHPGRLILSDDHKTIIFKPNSAFSFGENVNVQIVKGIMNTDGEKLKPIQYHFNTIVKQVDGKYLKSKNLITSELKLASPNKYEQKKIYSTNDKILSKNKTAIDSLPPDFPYIQLLSNHCPFHAQIFAAPFYASPDQNFGYLIILENDAVPIFYRRFDHYVMDFMLQSNGNLTYFDGGRSKFFELNSFYSVIDSFTCGNGYSTDLHDFIILPNGHSLMIAFDHEIVRMDTIVNGGDSAAVVTGNIIQELDKNKNVVFQWRTWDHFNITDATPDIDLTAHTIDYAHCNAIEEDTDGNLLLSFRNMDEVTKIKRQTGEIIWRLGGEYCKNNQFTFLNDSTGFSHQHDIRRISNGNITLFDNGNLHDPAYSRACEYQINEINKTIDLIWEKINDPHTFTYAMGKVQRLTNGNTFIGWGANNGPPSISEIRPDGITAWAVSFPDTIYSYRAFKYNWSTNYFVANHDSISFLNVKAGESDTVNFVVTNNSDSVLILNDSYISDSSFSLIDPLPLLIQPHENINLSVKFEPNRDGYFEGFLHLMSNHYTEMIAQAVFLRGTTDSVFTLAEGKNLTKDFRLYQNYPNPFNPSTTISYMIPFDSKVKICIFDILGREVATLVDKEQLQGKYEVNFNASNLSSGVYFYRIELHGFGSNNDYLTDVKKLLLIK